MNTTPRAGPRSARPRGTHDRPDGDAHGRNGKTGGVTHCVILLATTLGHSLSHL